MIGAAIGLISDAVIQKSFEVCYDTVNIRVRNVVLDWVHASIKENRKEEKKRVAETIWDSK